MKQLHYKNNSQSYIFNILKGRDGSPHPSATDLTDFIAVFRSSVLASFLPSAICLLFLLLSSAPLLSQEIEMEVSPNPAFVGEPVQLSISSSVARPQVMQLPEVEGLRWLGGVSNRQETRIVNLKATTKYVSTYSFVPEKEGKFQIPRIKVDIGKKKVLSDSLDLNVVSRTFNVVSGKQSKGADSKTDTDKQGKPSKLEDLLFVKAIPINEKKNLYVGEEIPFEIRLYSINGLVVNCSWPEITIENVVLKDFGKLNSQNQQFEPVRSFSEEVKGQMFNVNSFRTALRPIAQGELSGKIRIETVVKIPSQNGRRDRNSDPFGDGFFSNFDDFFSPFANYEQYKYELTDKVGPISVKELPPAPPNSSFLGLVGNWNVNTEFNQEKIKAGEPLSFKIEIKGQGTLDTLKAPDLQFNGFRSYPPEIDRKPNLQGRNESAEIRYVLIPLEEGPAEISFTMSYFSTKDEKYVELPFSRKFRVEKSDGISQPQIVSNAGQQGGTPAQPDAKSAAKPKSDGIIYLKKNPGGQVLIPLWRNHAYSILALLLLGILVPVAGEAYHLRQAMFSSDPILSRKLNARRRKGRVIGEIRRTDPEKIHAVIQNEVLPYLNDSLGNPPGTSIGELCEKLEDKELASCLKEGELGSYMPGASKDPAELKERLIRIIKNGAFAVALAVSAVFCCVSEAAAEDKPASADDNPLAAYNNGDFKKAAEYYRTHTDMKNPHPAYLYDLANCLYQQGEFPKALVLYERALRLSPRDSDIRENLNFLRRKLMQPEIGKVENPADFITNLRDSLRPDEWILLAAICWCACGLALALRRRMESMKVFSMIAIFAAIMLICLAAYLAQNATTYNGNIGFITEKNPPVYQLPSENAARAAEFRLNGGEEVRVEEQNDGWSRIRTGNAEGWVRSSALEKLWP